MLERFEALPSTVRYAVLLVAAEGVLMLGASLLTLAHELQRGDSGGLVAAVGVVIFLPVPLAMLALAWLMVEGRPWTWRAALAYVILAGAFYLVGLLSSFTNIAGVLIAGGAVALLLRPSTRVHFRRRAARPRPEPGA
jgi:hypothetical protein